MNDLRVCLVCDNFFPNYDGVVIAVFNYHKYFLKHGNSLLVVPRIGKKKKSKLKNIYYVRSTPNVKKYVTPYPHLDWELKRQLKIFKPNIIHIHSPFVLGKYFLKYAQKNHIPCLMTFHTKYYLDFKRILKFTLLSKIALKMIVSTVNEVDYLFTVNKKMIKEMRSYGIDKKLIKILPNGNDLITLEKHRYFKEINKKFNIPSKAFLGVYVGRVIKYKNLNLIINTAFKLSKLNVNFKFLICGDGIDLQWMKEKIDKLKITNSFIFTGRIDDRILIAKIYARANLNLIVSLFDTVSLSVSEAASQYTPSLCIVRSLVAANIKDKINGYLTLNSADKAAETICEIIKNEERHKKISKRAHSDFHRTWEQSCENATKIYEKCLKKFNKNHRS